LNKYLVEKFCPDNKCGSRKGYHIKRYHQLCPTGPCVRSILQLESAILVSPWKGLVVPESLRTMFWIH